VGAVWLAGGAAGLALVAQYDYAAGIAGAAPTRWPSDATIPLSEHGHTLVLFAHPRCPCTRASLGELERLVARCPEGLTVWVVFYQPAGADAPWKQTDQWSAAEKIPHVTVMSDAGGAEARRFNARTSGHAMLYSPGGELAFSGGITTARGHAGDNDGRSAIEAAVRHGACAAGETPVYGCPIFRSAPRRQGN
jgi:hypothetical protein